MPLQKTDPDSQLLAAWLRQRRKSAGLTQEEVVQQLRGIGLSVSRGHFASLEQGRGLKPDHVVALDQLFDGGGEFIALAETEWGRPLSSSRQEAWAQLAEGIHEDWVELVESSLSRHQVLRELESASLPPSPVPNIEQARTWWETVRDGDVIEQPDRIEAAVVYLLTLAAGAPGADTKLPIEFCGSFEGFRKAGRKPGLPKLVRDAVRQVMERAWECHHYIPMHPDDIDATTLVYVALPLIACGQFSARTVDMSRVPVVENLLVVPGLGTMQFYATANTRRIDAAVIHKRAETRRVIEQRVKQIASASEAFDIERFERPRQPDVTAHELGFQELLTSVDELGGNCYVFAGDFPSSTIDEVTYADAIARRETLRDKPTRWERMKDLHQDRANLLRGHLEPPGFAHQVIVSSAALRPSPEPEEMERNPDRDYTKVYLSLQGQVDHLKRVKELMKKRGDLFQVGIVDDEDVAARIERCKWQVRDRGSVGALIVHTDCTPPITSSLRRVDNQPVQVDLKIDSRTVVRAFTAFFREVWRTKTETDQVRVSQRLDDAIKELEGALDDRARRALI